MKDFFRHLFSDSNKINEKIFFAFVALMYDLIYATVSLFIGNINIDVFNGFLIFAGSCLGISVFDKFKIKIEDKKEIKGENNEE